MNSTNTSGFASAIQKANESDYVILMLGLDTSVESENLDRTNISLPGVQQQFADEILALGKPTSVVLINGGSVAISQLKETAPAIVEAFYPGTRGGDAIAQVLFGDFNPGMLANPLFCL